jgi:hypothetical protein
MLISVLVVNGNKYKTFFTLLLLLPILSRLFIESHLNPVTTAITASFFAYMIYLMIIDLFAAQKITPNIIFGSICIYLLISVFWSFIYILIANFIPNSFNFSDSIVSREEVSEFLYYSLSTLTTLGYGDLTATSAPARSISVLEAVVGQIYLAILVARFVGINISQNINKSK